MSKVTEQKGQGQGPMASFKRIEDCEVRLIASTKFAADAFGGSLSEDYLPCVAARVSHGKDGKTGEDPKADIKLMRYLAENDHMSPFEHLFATIMIECPLFVRSQIMRHRTFSYNEISRRYTSADITYFYLPDALRLQHPKNKQMSVDHRHSVGNSSNDTADGSNIVDDDAARAIDATTVAYRERMISIIKEAVDLYNGMAFGPSNIAREQARMILPQCALTRFYMSGNLRNWVHFLSLRNHETAQYETRVIAEKIERILKKLWPQSFNALSTRRL